ncbi:MAG: aldolase/citrate lyase family protein [Oscillospiraceae bacterium]
MNRSETLKARIRSGKPVFGTFVENNCPNLVEMLGWAGFDFAILDCEHSSYSYGELENMIRACQLGRPGLHSPHRLPGALAGPSRPGERSHSAYRSPASVRWRTPRSARRRPSSSPGGTRSPNPALRAGQYGCWTGEKSYLETKKESSLCVVQVESMAMAAAVEELCRIPQIDVLFVGPGDLSMSMGKPGKLNDPEVAAVIET